MATVEYLGATRRFDPEAAPAVDSMDLRIDDGEFLVLVGPSGCGKSTSLRMVAGLEPVDEGEIRIAGADVVGKRPRERDVAMVFQSYALYPNMTARQNMAFALENARVPKADITRRVAEASRILQLDDLLDRRPANMSGGQRQRVAMGRAIVREPSVFCMDEPLSNLDAKLRVSTRTEIAALQRRLGVTTIYVTHDQTEAMTMGDRVCVLDKGRVQQVASPQELYERPVNTFVAAFMGSPPVTLIDDVPVESGHAVIGEDRVPLPIKVEAPTVIAGLRPDGWELSSPEDPRALEFEVLLTEWLGSEHFAYAKPCGDLRGASVRGERVIVRIGKKETLSPGAKLYARAISGEVQFFDAVTERNLCA